MTLLIIGALVKALPMLLELIFGHREELIKVNTEAIKDAQRLTDEGIKNDDPTAINLAASLIGSL